MGLKENFERFSPQSKIIGSFIVPFIIGVVSYTLLIILNRNANTSIDFSKSAKNINTHFSGNITVAISIFGMLNLFYLILFAKIVYPSIDNRAKVITLILTFIAMAIWITVFLKEYYHYKTLLNTDKQSFLCTITNDKCISDGTVGPHIGTERYIFKPPNSKTIKTFIPANKFNTAHKNKLTLSFWLNIKYDIWKTAKFFGKDKIIFMKGVTLENASIAVWALPNVNKIQIVIHNEYIYVADFDFDKWYNYSIVINNNTVEFYKNATLDKTIIAHNNIFVINSPIFIGRTQDNKFQKFPGELIFLTYYNDNLNPNEIYKEYKEQYDKISVMNPDINKNKIKNFLERCKNEEFTLYEK